VSLVHHDADPDDPVFVHTFGMNGLGNQFHGLMATAPASGTLGAANRGYNLPFYLSKPYPLARWFWLNGATVGTDYIQAAIYDRDFRLQFASPRVLSAGTVNQLQFTNPGVAITTIDGSASSADNTSYNHVMAAGVTLRQGQLYLLAIANTHATDAAVVSAITGSPSFPGTFTSRASVQFNGTLSRISLWSVIPTADWTGTLTFNYGASTQTNFRAQINRVMGADTATNDGVVQTATGTGTSVTPLATLAAFGSVNNGTFGCFSGGVQSGTPNAGWQEIQDNVANVALQSAYRSDNATTVDYTLAASAPWGAIGAEIKADTSPFWVPAMRGYLFLWITGTTATLYRRTGWTEFVDSFQNPGLGGSGTPEQQTSQVGGPSGAGIAPVFGFTRRASP
jgi:hypothetical protein